MYITESMLPGYQHIFFNITILLSTLGDTVGCFYAPDASKCRLDWIEVVCAQIYIKSPGLKYYKCAISLQ